MTLNDTDPDLPRRLLRGAVAVWRIDADVEAVAADPPTILIRDRLGNGVYVTRRSGGDLPPCWEVRRASALLGDGPVEEIPARRYAAVPGMLRGVRTALDPDASAGRLIIGSSPGGGS